ncbi:hypothetical protein SteCoe_35539 [Stentor coeruleus]|uniref:protein-serine/threonine phosphatase n=1 Tax=Stentor coeruleus TaxID=5963 RepID=A0A1R2AS22_9CILI|nr:hypothetical protein SteCoe_35539 [Stentor coeruleus]
MNFEQVRSYLNEIGIEFPPGNYSTKELEEIMQVARNLPQWPQNEIVIPNMFDNPCHLSTTPTDPRLLDYDFRKMLLRVKKIGGLAQYTNSYLSVRKLNIVMDLDWTMIYAFRTNLAYSEPQVELELKRLKVKYSNLKLEKKYIPSSQIYLIIAIRPNLTDFLSKLVRIATLYVYTSAEEEYARIVLSMIDPTKRLFENRIYASLARNANSNTEKTLETLRLDDLDNVLIFDDQIDVWKVEYRDFVIPSMRFTPLYKEDQEFQTSKTFADKIFTYVYEKSVRGYRDEKTPFIDDKGTQLDIVFKLVNDVYEERFGSIYSISAANLYQNVCKSFLANKTCSLNQITGPERENKINTFTAILNRLGANVTDDNPDIVLVDSLQNTNNPNAKTVTWLLFKYFGYSSLK